MSSTNESHLIRPHGGTLVNLMVDKEQEGKLKELAHELPSWDLSARQLCDLELLMIGAMSPLTGFMTHKDYDSVLQNMRLSSGEVWPIPIVLDVTEDLAKSLGIGERLALRDPEGLLCAVLHVEDVWQADRLKESQIVNGTADPAHTGANFLLNKTNPWYVGGKIEGIHLPIHYDYLSMRLTPSDLRQEFTRLGWRKIVAFQTRNPMHRAHFHIALQAAIQSDANLLIHPVVGLTKPGDIDHYVRVRCYQAILPYCPKDTVKLSLLPLAMRMAGPREALWHALIRKNYGCSHFVIGRDHASPGISPQGTPWYDPYAAQELVKTYEKEIDIKMVAFQDMVYVPDLDEYVPANEVKEGVHSVSISGTELREKLAHGKPIPEWFTFPEVAKELRDAHPPRNKQGLTIFFTGLSGSGKSTIAHVLQIKLLELGSRPVTLLDGDVVRKHLSSELGFSPTHRNINILRIGFVASEVTKNGGIAICAPIAPYKKIRQEVRDMIKPYGGFVLVHCSTPIEECEKTGSKRTLCQG